MQNPLITLLGSTQTSDEQGYLEKALGGEDYFSELADSFSLYLLFKGPDISHCDLRDLIGGYTSSAQTFLADDHITSVDRILQSTAFHGAPTSPFARLVLTASMLTHVGFSMTPAATAPLLTSQEFALIYQHSTGRNKFRYFQIPLDRENADLQYHIIPFETVLERLRKEGHKV